MKSVTTPKWTKENLHEHLKAAIQVEFYTIPLYLTAAYSIKKESRKTWMVTVNGENEDGTPAQKEFSVFDTVFSVAKQEMYHLMWICNVARACGMKIEVLAPDFTKLPTTLKIDEHIVNNYKGVSNLADVIDLLVAIEKPDTKYKYKVDPDTPITKFAGPTSPDQSSYTSIGDMYHALGFGINELWDSVSDKSYDAYQKEMIAGAYNDVPGVTSKLTALNAIGAICEQGEGTGVDGHIPTAYIPKSQAYSDEDRFTHYERFIAIQKSIASSTGHLYPATHKAKAGSDQQSLTLNYSILVDGINKSYTLANGTLMTPGMRQMAGDLDNLFKAGTLPNWTYKANESIPPAIELHICQGLNSCAGHGTNGSGTMPGDGDCATVFHSCSAANSCRGQGACGYPSSTIYKNHNVKSVSVPGANDCSGMGGCQSPISIYQVFDSGKLEGQYVWCRARSLFEKRMLKMGMPFAPAPTSPTVIRQSTGTITKNKIPMKSCTPPRPPKK